MNVLINKSTARGKISAPPSKSMAHRMLICSFLAGGGKVSGIEYSEDIKATENCLGALKEGKDLYCGESGSTLRFMIPVCLVLRGGGTLYGSERLLARDFSVYKDLCENQGIYFEQGKDFIKVSGTLKSGKFFVRGDISSQFITGLLFALPLVSGDSEIILTTDLESRPYIDLTLKALSDFGVEIETLPGSFKIKGGQKYAVRDVTVEGDYSNAAFFDAFNCIGGEVEVTGLDKNSLQGDRVYKEYFEILSKEKADFDVSNCPDLAPVLMALAAAKNGCTLKGTRRLKIKESDRGEAMRCELEKFGAEVTVMENEITVGKIKNPPTAHLCGHNDHRIVMALSVLCSVTGGIIEGAEAVSKSLPDFFERIKFLGIEVLEK